MVFSFFFFFLKGSFNIIVYHWFKDGNSFQEEAKIP